MTIPAINKNLLTNLIALSFLALGKFLHIPTIYNIGIFAFSGAITNWIAIHMLFEKVPFLYGSGVITRRFEDFKLGIKNLLIEEFFTDKNINSFLPKQDLKGKIDYEKIFQELLDAIVNSPLGGMLAIVGGKEALLPLKEPIIEKLKQAVDEVLNDIGLSKNHDKLQDKILHIIDSRLTELTPQIVKEIIQKMIRQHLGWLVIWGGIFGGLIGLIYSYI
jgi:uncharacterized membrane protein YheB (UPF0754 family)